MRASYQCLCFFPEAGASWSLIRGEDRADSWVGLEGDLGDLSAPLVVVCAGIMRSTCFCSQNLRSCSWASVLLYLIVHTFPPTAHAQLFLAPYGFFISVACRDVCPGTSTAAMGPGPKFLPIWTEV